LRFRLDSTSSTVVSATSGPSTSSSALSSFPTLPSFLFSQFLFRSSSLIFTKKNSSLTRHDKSSLWFDFGKNTFLVNFFGKDLNKSRPGGKKSSMKLDWSCRLSIPVKLLANVSQNKTLSSSSKALVSASLIRGSQKIYLLTSLRMTPMFKAEMQRGEEKLR
jgi:hypothetical protein